MLVTSGSPVQDDGNVRNGLATLSTGQLWWIPVVLKLCLAFSSAHKPRSTS